VEVGGLVPTDRPERAQLPASPLEGAEEERSSLDDTAAERAAPSGDNGDPPLPPLNPIQAKEREVLLQLHEQYRWNVSNVAKALDVSRNTLYRKLHKLHIEISHPE